MKKKVLVAFSGGLDTSFCVKYLKEEKGYDVYTALVNTGGFSDKELKDVTAKALKLGAVSHENIDITQEFYDKALRYMIFGNVLRGNTYPISVSSERVFQAIAIIEYAKSIGVHAVAHGSTGAGNDQVRFDMIFQTLAPEIEVIALIRDLALSRQQEIDYLKEHGAAASWEKSKYSINQGIWGTSVGGVETLHSDRTLPEEAYPSQLRETKVRTITLDFEKGEPVGLNGKKMTPLKVIAELEKIASAYAIGRDMHVGDTIIGIKGRVGFEAAAAMVIIKAHHMLEKHTMTKWQAYWKEQIGEFYGMLMHEGQYLDPVMRNMEAFLEDSQKSVTGRVGVILRPYTFLVEGVQSPYDMMNAGFGEYGEMNKAFTGRDAEGFIKVLALPNKIYYHVNGLSGQKGVQAAKSAKAAKTTGKASAKKK